MELLETKEQFIELRAKGWSYDKIAKKLGKAKQTLIDWNKDFEYEISNLKSLELEALYDKYYLLKEGRIKMFGGMVQKLKEEAMNRDLSELPTDKLLDLLLKYDNQVNEEVIELRFKTSGEVKEDNLERILLDELTNLQAKPMKRLKVG